MNAVPPLLRLIDVTRRHGAAHDPQSFALGPLTLDVLSGTWTSIVGRSGAGKTTLLQIMGGLDAPDTGRVVIANPDVSNGATGSPDVVRRFDIGFVYQQGVFVEHLPVWQNVAVRLIPAGVPARERRRRAAAVLEELGIGEMLDRRPASLSGGEQQRVAVARAVVHQPRIVIADEPTSNVDADTGSAIVNCLKGLQTRGSAIIVATHDSAVSASSDRCWHMESGRIVDE
ncbi:MAG: ATP-binding cassette domain-containing protein [Phycisphaerales bacterium]|nr:ATP-binding cassette domain-containing protein [Phycisphaerales bacterium]